LPEGSPSVFHTAVGVADQGRNTTAGEAPSRIYVNWNSALSPLAQVAPDADKVTDPETTPVELPLSFTPVQMPSFTSASGSRSPLAPLQATRKDTAIAHPSAARTVLIPIDVTPAS
jgi:hypothetical protein